MRSPDNNHIPIQIDQSTPEIEPTTRHQTAREKGSLTTRVSQLICAVFLALFFLIGLTTFILWLSLRPHGPRFNLHEFSIHALAQEGGFENARIIYNSTARNSNQNIGIHYDSMELTVYYDEDQSVGGSPLLFPFYQKPKNTTLIAGQLGGAALKVTDERWRRFMADLGRGEVGFRFEITASIRFRISSWDSKRHKVHANCPVGVGPDGLMLPNYKNTRCPVHFS